MARARTSRKSRHADNGRKKTRARKPHSHLEVVSKKGTRYVRGPSANGWVKKKASDCGCGGHGHATPARRRRKTRKAR